MIDFYTPVAVEVIEFNDLDEWLNTFSSIEIDFFWSHIGEIHLLQYRKGRGTQGKIEIYWGKKNLKRKNIFKIVYNKEKYYTIQ